MRIVTFKVTKFSFSSSWTSAIALTAALISVGLRASFGLDSRISASSVPLLTVKTEVYDQARAAEKPAALAY